MTGTTASNAMIRLTGPVELTFDGSTYGGTDRSLSFENLSTTAPSSSVSDQSARVRS